MMNYGRNTNSIQNYFPIIFIGIILLVLNNLGLLKPKPKDETEDDEQNLIDDIKPSNVHYSKSQFDQWSNELQDALGSSFDGTDEDTIYRIIRKMKSNDDYNSLLLAYGKRPYKEFWALSFQEEFKTLPQAITYEMETYQIVHINNILKQNGLTVRI